MINLNEAEVIQILETIASKQKHQEKSLFFKIQYAYARRGVEIASLKVSDIDFTKEKAITFAIAKKRDKKVTTTLTIDANPTSFISKSNLVKELKAFIKSKGLSADDYLFLDHEKISTEGLEKVRENYLANLRRFLKRDTCKNAILLATNKDIVLDQHDFRRMRGQHLYLAGVGLETLRQLYQHEDVKQTSTYLQVDDLIVSNVLANY